MKKKYSFNLNFLWTSYDDNLLYTIDRYLKRNYWYNILRNHIRISGIVLLEKTEINLQIEKYKIQVSLVRHEGWVQRKLVLYCGRKQKVFDKEIRIRKVSHNILQMHSETLCRSPLNIYLTLPLSFTPK